MNYYQIHKNKRPKRLRNRKFNYGTTLACLVGAIEAVSIATTMQNKINSVQIKKLLIFKKSLNTSLSVIDSLDKPRQDNFKKTGMYNLKKGEVKNRKMIAEKSKEINQQIQKLIENENHNNKQNI